MQTYIQKSYHNVQEMEMKLRVSEILSLMRWLPPPKTVFLFLKRQRYGRDVNKTIAPAPWCVTYSLILGGITELKNCEGNSHLVWQSFLIFFLSSFFFLFVFWSFIKRRWWRGIYTRIRKPSLHQVISG